MVVKKLFASVGSILFPDPCINCGDLLAKGDIGLCDRCFRLWQKECQAPCSNCGYSQERCHCFTGKLQQRHLSDYHLPVTRKMILSQKDQKLHSTARFFGRELAVLLRREPLLADPDSTVICYVPRHPVSKRISGTDQAYEISKALSEALGIPLLPALEHKKHLPIRQQKMMTLAGRRAEAGKKYRYAKKKLDKSALFGKTVLLVDDVITTGSTVSACGELLCRHGASRVIAVAPAKSNLPLPENDNQLQDIELMDPLPVPSDIGF